MAWFKKWFNEQYLEVYSHRNQEEAAEDIEKISRLIPLHRHQPILDLACGNGRHALALAARGYQVVGIDLSESLLKAARCSSRESGCLIPLVRADKRSLPFVGAFGCVLNFFTSFGYFRKPGDNLRVLKEIFHCLRPGGIFFIDHLNKDRVIQELVPEDTRAKGGKKITQHRRYDAETRRLEKRIDIEDAESRSSYEESVRLYTRAEMEQMAEEAGLKVVRVLGGFDGRNFNPEAERMVVLGERPHETNRAE